jgi:hypothetical protein
MRRRENAKTIPASQLVRDSKVLPRLAPVIRMPVRPLDTYPLKPLAAALESPAIVSRALMPHSTLPAAAVLDSLARPMAPAAFSARPKRLALPQSSDRFEPRLLPAGAVLPRLNGAALARLRREVTELRMTLRRRHIGDSGIQVKPLRLPTQNCQEPQPARRINSTADRGVELRVSGGIGFCLTKPLIRSIDFGTTRLRLPSRANAPRGLTQSARPRRSISQTAGVVRFVVRGPASPLPPQHSNGVGFHIPEALLNGAKPPREFRTDPRACGVKWLAPSPRPPQVRHTNGEARLRTNGPVFPVLDTPEPRGIPFHQRITEVAFQPQETMFECPTALHGTLLSNVPFGAAAPLRKVEPPPVALEEHFDSGLNDWTGATGNWKVDVAGVRPGGLAFYSPSMELSNYLLEFLTRIEQRGMTWVFRAADDQGYYKATLAMAQGGGFEFRRSSIIGGLEEGATVRSVPPASPAPTGKTAVTVRTRVAGNEFTVSIDGQVIDTWTDARLTAGGIGFVGAPEERARLYWVKVTPIGHTSKEYSKR